MGDKNNATSKLKLNCKSIKYQISNMKEVEIGSPREYLSLYHYLFMEFSPLVAHEILEKHNLELSLKNDKSFMDGVYKLSRDMFNYTPKISKDQFFHVNYAAVKAMMACDLIEHVRAKVRAHRPSHLAGSGNVAANIFGSATGGATMMSSTVSAAITQVQSNKSKLASASSFQTNHLKETNTTDEVELNEESKSPPARQILHVPTLMVQNHLVQAHGSGSGAASGSSQQLKPSLRQSKLTSSASFSARDHREGQLSRFKQHGASVVNEISNQVTLSSATDTKFLAQFESILREINAKLSALSDRVLNIETKLDAADTAQTRNNPCAQQLPTTASTIDVSALGRSVDELARRFSNISNRFTILETDNTIIKQNLSAVMNEQNGKQNESQDMSLYQSFCSSHDQTRVFDLNDLLTHNGGATTSGNGNGGMSVKKPQQIMQHALQQQQPTPHRVVVQGLPVDVERMGDLSLNSNDSTPTLFNTMTSRLARNCGDSAEPNEIARAKQLVMRASNLNEALSTQLKI